METMEAGRVKTIEKLAREHVDASDPECAGVHADPCVEMAFAAGFRKAREMGAAIFDPYMEDDYWSPKSVAERLRKLGEEDVDG